MRIQTFYRLAVWLPIVVPSIVAGVVNGLGVTIEADPVQRIVFFLLSSLLYGAVPYSLLALWATWWIDGRPESEIRRLAFVAPLLMIAVFVPTAVLLGVLVGNLRAFLFVGGLGAIAIIPVGYGYVALVILLREMCRPAIEKTVEELR